LNFLSSRIAVIGLGYVGLPLAIEFGKKFKVLGFDLNIKRIKDLSSGIDQTKEADLTDLSFVLNNYESFGLKFSSNVEDLRSYNIYIVTVPTPINQFKAPDLSPLLNASAMLGSVLSEGDLVIYESTVYPGCTEDDCVPVLEKFSGLRFNVDFFLWLFS